MDLLVLGGLATVVAVAGVLLGMLMARRLDRWLVDRDEKPRDESDGPD